MNYAEDFQKFLRGEITHEVVKRVVLIDGLNIFIRNFKANPALNHNGEHIGGILGFYRELNRIVKEYNPYRIIIAFDGEGGSLKRKKLYPEYKEGRSSGDRSLNRSEVSKGLVDEHTSMTKQLKAVVKSLAYLPITVMEIDHIEADDCIALCVKQLLPPEDAKIIFSSDKDFLQLIDPKISVYQPQKKMLISYENMHDLVGYSPHNYLTLRCFTGDNSDNIKGAYNVGPKTLDKYFALNDPEKEITVEDILQGSEEKVEGSKIKLYESIVSAKDIVNRNYQLMQLQEVDISSGMSRKVRTNMDYPVPQLNRYKLSEILSGWGIANIFGDLLTWLNVRG